jgi:hypothetical protein
MNHADCSVGGAIFANGASIIPPMPGGNPDVPARRAIPARYIAAFR